MDEDAESRVTAVGIRARTRRELTAAIKAAAGRQLAEYGAAGLSLRAVARELKMASSAVYRYFPSRDELLTALVIDGYNDLGAAAERADAAHRQADPVDRWIAVCRAVRAWALASPHVYALLYGTPVPGYHAPTDTVVPASRVGLVLTAVVADADRAGRIAPPPGSVPPGVARDADLLAAALDVHLPRTVVAAIVAAWAQLFGLIGFELFGQFENVVAARDGFFDLSARRLAESVGLGIAEPQAG